MRHRKHDFIGEADGTTGKGVLATAAVVVVVAWERSTTTRVRQADTELEYGKEWSYGRRKPESWGT